MAAPVERMSSEADAYGIGADSDYLENLTESLWASTDMAIVVEGTALPCHKQIMALHSKVFAGMVDSTSSHEIGSGALPHTSTHRLTATVTTRLENSSRAVDVPPCLRPSRYLSAGDTLQIEAPFDGKQLSEMCLLMHAIYRCSSRSNLLGDSG